MWSDMAGAKMTLSRHGSLPRDADPRLTGWAQEVWGSALWVRAESHSVEPGRGLGTTSLPSQVPLHGRKGLRE